MRFLTKLVCSITTIGALSLGTAASAQMAVIDGSNLAKAIETARNTLRQIEEARRLYDSANRITDVSSVGNVLNNDLVKRGLPSDVRNTADLVTADLSELGSIGDRANSILQGRGLTTSNATGLLNSVETLAARNQAIAEVQMDVAKQTSNGLDQLKDRLRTAETAKETADLNARATLEVAQLVNRSNQMQALRDAQNAERELAIAEDIKKVNEDNARALREGLKGLTWRKKQ
jgi:conjugal transfer/entry exclusion protein